MHQRLSASPNTTKMLSRPDRRHPIPEVATRTNKQLLYFTFFQTIQETSKATIINSNQTPSDQSSRSACALDFWTERRDNETPKNSLWTSCLYSTLLLPPHSSCRILPSLPIIFGWLSASILSSSQQVPIAIHHNNNKSRLRWHYF